MRVNRLVGVARLHQRQRWVDRDTQQLLSDVLSPCYRPNDTVLMQEVIQAEKKLSSLWKVAINNLHKNERINRTEIKTLFSHKSASYLPDITDACRAERSFISRLRLRGCLCACSMTFYAIHEKVIKARSPNLVRMMTPMKYCSTDTILDPKGQRSGSYGKNIIRFTTFCTITQKEFLSFAWWN